MPKNIEHTRTERLLLEAARVFNSTLEYEELLVRVLKLVMNAVGSEAALVFRVDHKRTDMRIRALKSGDEKMTVFNRELDKGVVGWVTQYKEPVIINNTADDRRVVNDAGQQIGIEVSSLCTVPLIGKGKMIGVIEAINKIDGEFTDSDIDILVGLSNQMAVAIDNANLYRDVKREALEKDLLFRIGMKLSGSLRLGELLDEVMDALHRTVDFDAGGVFLVDPSKGKVDSIHAVGYDDALDADLQLKIGQGLIGHVANSAEPVIVPDVRSDDRYVDARGETCSEIVVPMMIDGKVIGVVNLESNRLNAFDNHALELLLAFSSQAALSIERAQMHEQILAGHRLHQQIDIARDIQRSFLPKSNPILEGYDICGRNVPSEQIGGDYYDFIQIVDNQTGVTIADVSGKGIPAALIMASVRASLIAEIRNNYSIRTICQKVNNLLCESLQPGNFVTALYSVLDSRNHILTFCNCGHDRPILMHDNGQIEYLADGGPVFGVTPDAIYRERPIFLHRGDLVMLFTDGVTETFDQSGNEFGYMRLEQILLDNRHRSADDILEEVFKAVHGFAGPDHIFDDLTMIVLKRF